VKKIFWIIGTVIVCILYAFLVGMAAIGISIITRSEMQPLTQDILNPIMAVGWGFLIVLSILMWKRWNVKCHACKRWAALKLESTDIIKQEKISVLVELENRDLDRNVTGTREQYIPGKRNTYQYTYKCKYCGNLEARSNTEDRASI
jgi:hypothetical protein